MALIKRAKPADAIDEAADEAPADDATEAADALELAAEQEPGDGGDSGNGEDADAATMDALAAVPAEPEPAEASGDGTDALLDMFSAVGIETVDRSVLVNLAGEVLIEDLISELNLVAAALGVVRAEHDARSAQDQLAA